MSVVDLSGKPLKAPKNTGKRNPVVTQMLKRASARNARGEIDSMVLITIDPDGVPTQLIHWNSDGGAFTYMLGAWEIAKQSLVQRVLDNIESEDILVEED